MQLVSKNAAPAHKAPLKSMRLIKGFAIITSLLMLIKVLDYLSICSAMMQSMSMGKGKNKY